MLKILQARLQHYMNCELPDDEAGFRTGRGTRDQIANIRWIIKSTGEFQKKTSISALLTMPKPLTVWIATNCENSSRDGNTRPPYLPPEKSVCRARSNCQNQTWNNRLAPNWERSTSRLYIVTLLFNLYAEYIMWNVGLDEVQAGIKLAGRNMNNLRYADDTILMAESKEKLNRLLMKVKEESEKVGLKHSEN